MKKYLIAGLALTLLSFTACGKKADAPKVMVSDFQQHSQVTAVSEMNLAGTINGNLKIHMNLKLKGNEVNGTYFYDNYKNTINLKGTKDSSNNISMNEYDAKGNTTGVFNGKFVAQNKIEGTWSKPDGSGKMPFSVVESNEPLKEEKKQETWAGQWNLVGANQFYNSIITIKSVNTSSFKFSLFAHNGGNSGQLEDVTAKINKNTAVFNDKENNFKITFTLAGDVLKVKEEGGPYFGAGVYVTGDYSKGLSVKELTLKDAGVFENDSQQQAFKNLVGGSYEKFTNAFQWANEEKDLDGLGAKVYTGFVRGLGENGIIMRTADGKIWAVVLSRNLEYYTNVAGYKNKLPKTIENWVKKFNGATLKYMSK